MVRLIEERACLHCATSGISIPFGSINSRFDFWCVDRLSSFQFLLVRLIDPFRQWLNSIGSISIPFGSINRGGQSLHNYGVAIFQFLLVRLIDYPCIQRCNRIRISIPFGSINSRKSYCCTTACNISIPFGSINSEFQQKKFLFFRIFQFLLVRLIATIKLQP